MSVNVSTSNLPHSTNAGVNSSVRSLFITEGENLVNQCINNSYSQRRNVKTYGMK